MQLLTIPEAAKALAVSVSMVEKLIAKRKLEAVKVGRCTRIRQDRIEKMVEKGTRKAA